MAKIGSMLFKPGTVFLFVLIAVFGFGVYSWADANIGKTRETSLEDQQNAIVCSNLAISNEGIRTTQNQAEIFFKANQDVKRVNLNFRGDSNVSDAVESVEAGEIRNSAVNISNFSSVSLKASGCSRIFRFE